METVVVLVMRCVDCGTECFAVFSSVLTVPIPSQAMPHASFSYLWERQACVVLVRLARVYAHRMEPAEKLTGSAVPLFKHTGCFNSIYRQYSRSKKRQKIFLEKVDKSRMAKRWKQMKTCEIRHSNGRINKILTKWNSELYCDFVWKWSGGNCTQVTGEPIILITLRQGGFIYSRSGRPIPTECYKYRTYLLVGFSSWPVPTEFDMYSNYLLIGFNSWLSEIFCITMHFCRVLCTICALLQSPVLIKFAKVSGSMSLLKDVVLGILPLAASFKRIYLYIFV